MKFLLGWVEERFAGHFSPSLRSTSLILPIGIVKQIRFGLICVSSCQEAIQSRRPCLPPLDRIRNTNIALLWRMAPSRSDLSMCERQKMPCHSNSNFSVKQKKMYSAKRRECGGSIASIDRASNTSTARQSNVDYSKRTSTEDIFPLLPSFSKFDWHHQRLLVSLLFISDIRSPPSQCGRPM